MKTKLIQRATEGLHDHQKISTLEGYKSESNQAPIYSLIGVGNPTPHFNFDDLFKAMADVGHISDEEYEGKAYLDWHDNSVFGFLRECGLNPVRLETNSSETKIVCLTTGSAETELALCYSVS